MYRKILKPIVRAIFEIERTVYCITGCRVELPLHRAYYERRREKYCKYLEAKRQLV